MKAWATPCADDPTGFEVMIAAIKPGTGEILAFGINRTYDATDDAKNDETKGLDELHGRAGEDGGGMGFNILEADQLGGLDAQQRAIPSTELAGPRAMRCRSSSCNDYFTGRTWA